MRSNSQCKLDQRIFVEQVRDCMDNGYLLPSKKIGSAAFSRVYLAYATRERMKHNPKLSSDLRGKNHIMNSQHSYLVLELAARGDLLECINAVLSLQCCPGLEEEEAEGFSGNWDLKCENILLDDQGVLKLTDFGFANCVGLKNSLLSTFCGSVTYMTPEILMSKKYDEWLISGAYEYPRYPLQDP
ncbi:Testis-specific serine/threonine-protein kinase 5 [Cricetulus griseus]|uniref:non-specific serine/threonine protein kinase n=1 Tax=Cricetulus griseus TaxID=10029 RepID=G3HWH9_CRIGR|nr:Testis-specific serine/threonine-protein kinase 5 [Cricetulus griseus]